MLSLDEFKEKQVTPPRPHTPGSIGVTPPAPPQADNNMGMSNQRRKSSGALPMDGLDDFPLPQPSVSPVDARNPFSVPASIRDQVERFESTLPQVFSKCNTSNCIFHTVFRYLLIYILSGQKIRK